MSMALNQLLKCVQCTSKNHSIRRQTTRHQTISFSGVNEMSEIIFDEEDDQSTNDSLPGLTKTEANDALATIWNQFVDLKKSSYEKELDLRMFIHTPSGKIFRWSQYINDGDKPDTGRSLWIIMYGCDIPPENQQIKLNESGSIWIIPRSSTDWQQEYIGIMLDRVIEYHVIVHEVNPNRVFLVGVSPIGGNGVYQIAPRMADRWAAAGVMDGHIHDVSPLLLRHLPFALFMSGENTTDEHILAARSWAQSLEQCSRQDFRGGFKYWMKIGEVKERKQDALAWMNKYTRNPWPKRLVWHHQDYTSQKRFYWLVLPFPEQVKKGQTIIVEVRNRKSIYLEQIPEEIKALTIRLSDTLVNLDHPLTVNLIKERTTTIFHGLVPRTRAAIEQSIEGRADPTCAATALLHVIWDPNTSTFSCHSSNDTELPCPASSLQTNQA